MSERGRKRSGGRGWDCEKRKRTALELAGSQAAGEDTLAALVGILAAQEGHRIQVVAGTGLQRGCASLGKRRKKNATSFGHWLIYLPPDIICRTHVLPNSRTLVAHLSLLLHRQQHQSSSNEHRKQCNNNFDAQYRAYFHGPGCGGYCGCPCCG